MNNDLMSDDLRKECGLFEGEDVWHFKDTGNSSVCITAFTVHEMKLGECYLVDVRIWFGPRTGKPTLRMNKHWRKKYVNSAGVAHVVRCMLHLCLTDTLSRLEMDALDCEVDEAEAEDGLVEVVTHA